MTTAEPIPSCIVCHRHRERWGVCDGCIARTDSQLGELIDLHTLAGTTAALTPAQTGEAGPIGGHREPPLPVSLDALDLAVGEWLLRSVTSDAGPSWAGLELWEVEWRNHFGLTPYGQASARRNGLDKAAMPIPGARGGSGATEDPNWQSDTNHPVTSPPRAAQRVSAVTVTLVGIIGFLRAWWPRAADEHPAADEFASDVRKMHARALSAVRLNEPRPWTVPCPADLDTGECGYRLQITYDGRSVALHCPRCGSDWNIERLLLVAAAAGRGVWVTIAEAADQIGVHRATIYRAVQAGTLTARGARVDLVAVREWNERRSAV